MHYRLLFFAQLLLVTSPVAAQSHRSNPDEQALQTLLSRYTIAWLNNDSSGVLQCFETNARLAPSGLCPIQGMDAMRKFWFPNDSSATSIHGFDNDVIEMSVEGDMAFSTQKTWLDWSYKKGDTHMGKEQRGYATTIFRRQATGEWKIWRQSWTDVWSRNKPELEVGKPAAQPARWAERSAFLRQEAEASNLKKQSEALIVQTSARFSQALMAGNWDAVAAAYTDDARAFPPGLNILQGSEALRAYWAASPKITHHQLRSSEMKISSAEAWDWGVYEGKSIGADGKEIAWKGKYIAVWREVAPGVWKMYLDIWNRSPE